MTGSAYTWSVSFSAVGGFVYLLALARTFRRTTGYGGRGM